MSRGMPSMTALLGLLAIAGYQNRDKLAELLKGADIGDPSGSQPGGLLANLGGMLGGAGIGGLLSGSTNCWNAARVKRLSPGSIRGPTKTFRLRNSGKQSDRTFSRRSNGRPDFHNRNCSRDYPASCRLPLTNTHQTDVYPLLELREALPSERILE